MAPSRRRGAGKAAAAAAARRQWKVGDLVLAKVKGFPAWPATVSEPEKWGYQADWKKVLVYFFGTQQIAFCNPADVEAFTEEKKQSLLTKRQGKGADFVRAVKEIIECYENSKNLDQVDNQNSDEGVNLGHGGISKESSADMESKDQNKMSEAHVTVKNDPNPVANIAPDVAKIDSLQDREASAEQPSNDVTVTSKPSITTYTSRKRSGGLRSRKRAPLKTDSAVDMPRSLSRLDTGRSQSHIISSNGGNKSGEDASTDITFERSLRRNKRIRKSPDVSELHEDVDLSALVSNGSIGDNGSEIVTVDSDSLSQNDNNTPDSACRSEHRETAENLEADVELSKGLDFQMKAVIKKKRKLNRKRTASEMADPPVTLETSRESDAVLQNSVQNSQIANENLNEIYNKENGDEHLPLVKRARVRMGKLSNMEESGISLSRAVEKSSNEAAVNPIDVPNGSCDVGRTSEDIPVTSMELVETPTSLNDDSADFNNSDVVKGSLGNSSPQRVCPQTRGNKLHVSITKESQPFGSPADGEAALPPSKRLHRALEAMSANAAERGDPYAEASSLKNSINSSCISSVMGSSHLVTARKESDGSEEHVVESVIHRASDIFSSDLVSETAVKSPSDAGICNQLMEFSKSQEHKKEALGDANCRGTMNSCSGGLSVCTGAQQSTGDLLPNLDRKQPSPQSDQDSADQLSHVKTKGDSEDTVLMDVPAVIADKDVAASECSRTNLRLVSQTSEAMAVPSQNGSTMLQNDVEDTEPLRSQIDKNQANGTLEESKDIKCDPKQKGASYASISSGHLGEKNVLVIHSSPVPADEIESPLQTSPTTTSRHVSTAESHNCNQNSGGSSPNHLKQKITVSATVGKEKTEPAVPQRPKSVGKSSNYAETHAALSSFEGILGSLTRTKESIGRATRIALDCAKFGVSSKVLEILARRLESEPSMHRRIDLFFLVDSIIQCSRGLKGYAGGIYPSAIQVVLPRLVSAAAPAGTFAQENRRQCLKVLRLWLERRVFPESIIRHHMRELDSLGSSSSSGAYSRRSSRTERALDDPVRDMEGMLVDEYGSNSSFQLPGLCMPPMLKDKGGESDSDGESFEAVTPEHYSGTPEEQQENNNTSAIEKHTHILEEVDGELEMEDVAPSCQVEGNSTGGIVVNNLHRPVEQHFPLPNAPPLPQDFRPKSPPLPMSPPPLPPPPPPLAPHSRLHEPYMNSVDSKLYTNSHNMHDDLRGSGAQHSASRTNLSISNGVSESREEQMQHSDSTSYFSGYPVQPVNNGQQIDAPSFHHKLYPPRPPQPPPSNQFSYVQAGQPRRETTPPSYHHHHHRYQSSYNGDGGVYYNNHERMRPGPYEHGDSWRYPSPNFHGPPYPDKARGSYPPGPYGGPPQEPSRMQHQEWPLPPRGMHQRNFMPYRPSPECGLPVSNRAWRPR